MPRSPEANEQIRVETSATIVQHALALFSKHGYDRTTIAMIAESAGIAQGLMYRYFDSKAALLRAIFEQSMGDVRASMAAAAEGKTPRERIELLIRVSFEIVHEHREFWRLSYAVRMQAAVLKELGPRVASWTAEIQKTLARFLRDADIDDPDVEAAILFALIDGVSQHYVLDPNGYPLYPVVEHIVNRYSAARKARR